jgi:hypothetical protein
MTAEKFADVMMMREVIRRGDRAHALRGVSASVGPGCAPAQGRWSAFRDDLRARLGKQSRRSGVVLTIVGPGFRWLVPVGPTEAVDACRFAETINQAARRITV